MQLEGKVAIVTGANQGIGRTIAVNLAKAGANIAAVDLFINEQSESLKQEIEQLGRRCLPLQADVSKEDEATALIDAVVEQSGRIDGLINNAGITRDGLILRMSSDDWDAVIQTNLTGVFYLCKAITKTMMRQRSGRIVNMGSIVGLGGNAGQVNYSAAKAGLVGLTRSLARELASRNVLVNCVAPGYVETDMTEKLTDEQRAAFTDSIPLRRGASSNEIAGVVSFLMSNDSSYITGQVINVDGGRAM